MTQPDVAEAVPDPAESALVARAQAGDADAFGDLVTMHQSAAFRVAYVLTGSAADAEDAAQEGFVKAYLALDRFRPDARFKPWLLAIVGNEARNRVRSRSRRDSLADRAIHAIRGSQAGPVRDGDDATAAITPGPELEALAGETQAELRAAMASLREDERLVVACRYLLGLSERETAAALGIPEGTAKSRLHRGLGRMREALEAAGTTLEATR